MAFRVDLRLRSPIIIIFRSSSCKQTTEQSRTLECNQNSRGENPVKMEKNPVCMEKNPVKMEKTIAWIHIPLLTAHYNAIAAFKNRLQEGSQGNLTQDAGFKRNDKAWREYQTKWVSWHKRMCDSPRIAPVKDNADVSCMATELSGNSI